MDEAAQYVATTERACPGVSMYGSWPGHQVVHGPPAAMPGSKKPTLIPGATGPIVLREEARHDVCELGRELVGENRVPRRRRSALARWGGAG